MKKTLNKIEKIPLAIKATLFFMIASVFEKGIGLITVPIFTRILPEKVFGQISVFNSWKAILNVLITFSLVGGVINSAMLDFEDDRDGFISSILSLVLFSTAVFFFVYYIIRIKFGDIFGYNFNLMKVMFMSFAFNSSIGIWSIKKRFNYEYKGVIFLSFLIAILSPILSYILIKYSNLPKLEAKIYGENFVVIFLNMIVFIVLIFKGKKIINLKYWKYALIFNLPLIPHYLSYIVLSQSDRIMIAKYVGEGAAGVYSLSYTIASIINIVISAINSSFVPWTYKMMKEKKYEIIGNNANKLAFIGGILSTIFILFAPEFIKIMAPPNYYSAVYVIPPVVLGTYYIFIYTFFGNIEFYHKQTKYVMFASVISGISNIVFNILFIPRYGFIAAGYTTMFSYFCMILIHYIFMKKIEKNIIYKMKEMSIILGITTLVGLGSVYLYPYILIRISILLAILGVIIKKRNRLVQIFKEREL
ncbi:lipopolysaccharide biosynthesis protein [Cetobacterium sp.]|uniref:lipopolysaccharide biosynthesis protein n=1 Tax=Cetobacterium sp. TaxID=2071632 RepID=UPI003F333A30